MSTFLNRRPFLKWPGGKFRLMDKIRSCLPQGKQLIEPFVGSGAVFLNTEYDKYLLNDANADLINLYQHLKTEGLMFINLCKHYFQKKYNSEAVYYRLRKKFNASKDLTEKSILFLYLNRHGYNGLCRYNQSKYYNVPFGRYVRPYFPMEEMKHCAEKLKQATLVCEDFSKTLARASKGSVVYCDPPYVPIKKTADFTNYQSGGFSLRDQQNLTDICLKLAAKNIPVLISNHSTEFTRELYKSAKITEFSVQRLISCQPENRWRVIELLALWSRE